MKDFRRALQLLLDLGLLARVETREGEHKFIVHRWTASALARRTDADERREAHSRAARYCRSEAERLAEIEPLEEDRVILEQLLEARFHHHHADELDEEIGALADGCTMLTRLGDFDRLRRLYSETLRRLEPGTEEFVGMQHELGTVAFRQGSWPDAIEWYRKALRGAELREDRTAVADAHHQLGMVAEARGLYEDALCQYRKALEIYEDLDDPRWLAGSHHQIGNVAYSRGRLDEASSHYRKALEIFEEADDRLAMSATYHQLGMVAYDRGLHDEAEDHFRRAIELNEEMGERPDKAASYHHLGLIAEERGAHREALKLYRASLEIEEEAGDRAGAAASYHQLANVAQRRGAFDDARRWHRKSLEIDESLGNRVGMADSYSQLGCLETVTGAPTDGMRLILQGLALRLEMGVPADFNLHWLAKQRELLGEPQFDEILREELGEAEQRQVVLELLEGHPGGAEGS